MAKIFKDVETALIDGLDRMIKDELHKVEIGRFQTDIYERASYKCGHEASAEMALHELGTWNCISVVYTYYEERQDEADLPELHDPCCVANYLIYIIGCELLQAIYGGAVFYSNNSVEHLGIDEIEICEIPITKLRKMLKEAKKWFKDNPNGIEKIWLDKLAYCEAYKDSRW